MYFHSGSQGYRVCVLAILVLQPHSRVWALLVGVHVHYVADITSFIHAWWFRSFLFLTLFTCFWNESLSTKSSTPPAPSWCGMSNWAAIFIVALSNFPRALRPNPRISMCLSTSSKGILPHHKWFSFPCFVKGGAVVGKPVPLSKHHVLKNVAALMFLDRSFTDLSL